MVTDTTTQLSSHCHYHHNQGLKVKIETSKLAFLCQTKSKMK
jgi:hypothetical protein